MRHRDVAIRPRLATSTDAWVVECADDRPAPILQRDASTQNVHWARADQVSVLFAGTLYDSDALRTRLGVQPDALRDPASALLQGYQRLEARAVEPLKGRFAAIVSDRSRRRLLAVRDPMGLHPLFYAESRKGLLFSPSMDALLREPDVDRRLNPVVVGEHLVHRWVDQKETYFAAVHRIPPGHVLIADGQRRCLVRYWDPAAEIEWLKEDELEQFGPTFERAVERTLAPGRASIFLSGGFDSVSVAAMATSISSRLGLPRPHALSIGFPDPDCGEQFVQRSVAQSLGLTQDLVPLETMMRGKGLIAAAVDHGVTCAGPLMNMWAPSYDALARLAHPHGCASILTGTGGDEWLNVTPFVAADLLQRGDVRELVRLIRVFRRSFRFKTRYLLRNTLWTCGLRPLGGALLDRVAPGLWRARRRERLRRSTPPWVAPNPAVRRLMDERAERVLLPSRPANGFYEREIRLALDHPLVTMEYEEGFEFGRRVGLEVLYPFLDADLVHLLYRTPPALLTKSGRTKSLIRDAVAKRFPELGFERQRKVDATNFYRARLLQDAPPVWRALGGAKALAELGVVDPVRLDETMNDLFGGKKPDQIHTIWTVLNLEAWVRARM